MGSQLLELVGQLRDDDGKLQPLLRTLDEISNRVQVADFHNAGIAAAANAMHVRRTVSPKAGSEALGRRQQERWNDGVPPGIRPAASLKVDDTQLPVPPDMDGLGLPAPEGVSDWNALSESVNEACSHFTSPSAKVTWKKWALNPANTSVMVSVFWSIITRVFRQDHQQAIPIQEYAFSHFARQYSSSVITYRGINKDLYHDLWLKVISKAVVNLLKDSFPRSAHKFNEAFEEFLYKHIKHWTAGSMPADLHPSLYTNPGDRVPAALVENPNANEWIPPPPPPVHMNETRSGVTSAVVPSGGFHSTKPSPVLEYLISTQGISDPRVGLAALPGRRTDRVGGGTAQTALRKPLDNEPADDFSYASLARECKLKAQSAVDRYEASKREASREVAKIRRGWVKEREHLEARAAGQSTLAARAKDLSDRLAHYIENDVDRLLREAAVGIAQTSFPVKAPAAAKIAALDAAGGDEEMAAENLSRHLRGRHGSAPASLPAYLASTTAQSGCLAGRVASGIDAAPRGPSSTRIMAPWSKMRSVEAGISSALCQSKLNSLDKASHVQAIQRNAAVAREGTGAPTLPIMSDGSAKAAKLASTGTRSLGTWESQPSSIGNKKGSEVSSGRRWRPSPIDGVRGTLDTRVAKAARSIMRGIDLEVYQ